MAMIDSFGHISATAVEKSRYSRYMHGDKRMPDWTRAVMGRTVRDKISFLSVEGLPYANFAIARLEKGDDEAEVLMELIERLWVEA